MYKYVFGVVIDNLDLGGLVDPIDKFSCEKKYCKDMVSCDEVRYQYEKCGFINLDRDGDGIYCENVCK